MGDFKILFNLTIVHFRLLSSIFFVVVKPHSINLKTASQPKHEDLTIKQAWKWEMSKKCSCFPSQQRLSGFH